MDHAFDTSFDSLTEPAPKRRRRRLVAAGVVVAVVLAGGAAVAGADADAGARYRTNKVATRAVDEVLHAVATVEPVSQASVAFPVAGTVVSVDVAVGDAVVVGQPLATLDTDALEATLTERQAALDQAELALEKALDGESVGDTGNSGDAETIALTAPSPSGDADTELSAAEHAVLDAQRQVDTDLLAAQQALVGATQICAGDEADATETDGHDGRDGAGGRPCRVPCRARRGDDGAAAGREQSVGTRGGSDRARRAAHATRRGVRLFHGRRPRLRRPRTRTRPRHRVHRRAAGARRRLPRTSSCTRRPSTPQPCRSWSRPKQSNKRRSPARSRAPSPS